MHLSFPITLPYHKPVEELPGPLPSVADIQSSIQILPTRQKNRRVVRVGAHFVVKYGSDLNLIEGENMLFLEYSHIVSVPKVYALFRDEATKSNYIIMQFIPGQSLASLWDSIDDTSKASIIQKLRKFFNELHQLPGHGYYGRLGKRPYFDELFMTLEVETHEKICGPFNNESEVIDGIVYRYICETPYSQRGEYLRRALPQVLHSEGPVFTHGDFQKKNVIVRGDGIPFVVDWEAAAFYPRYYEYYTAMVAFGHYRDDWHVWIGKILDEYVAELGWLDTIRRELL